MFVYQKFFVIVGPEDIEWDLKHKLFYVYLGLLQLCINPLVHPGLSNSTLFCIVDSPHCQFSDALIGVFSTPLNNGVVWLYVIPRYVISVTNPKIH